MKKIANDYVTHFSDWAFIRRVLISLFMLLAALVVNYSAGTYASREASNPVTDIVLSNTPTFDLDGTFVYGIFALVLFVGVLCLEKPQRIPFVLKSSALFAVIRSAFVVLTHIAPYPSRAIIDPASWMNEFSFGADLFFSGHTGLPFLMAFIFWDDLRLRIFFMAASVFFGIVVLLAHLHYSIDVLAAFFITYSIYRLAEIFFAKDRLIFKNGIAGMR